MREVEDELFDLNKEPVERKRKRPEINNFSEKGNEGSNGLPKSGRVLRSRTVAMSDGEKEVIKMKIVDESEVVEYKDENLQKGGKKKGRRGRPPKLGNKLEVPPLMKKRGRGRPPKGEGKSSGLSSSTNVVIKCDVPFLEDQKKRGRGRPPKGEGKCGVSLLNGEKDGDVVVEQKKKLGRPPKKRGRPPKMVVVVDEGEKVMKKRGRPKKDKFLEIKKRIVKGKRPPKMGGGGIGLPIKKKVSNIGGKVEGLRVDKSDLGNVVEQKEGEKMGVREKKEGEKKWVRKKKEGEKMGLRERKQVLRDQIVAMLSKAGWKVEHRQRMSKLDYWDAVYVDRVGRTYWSVTLAYKKFKESIDNGKADDRDLMAFSVIPEETLSLLFRVTEPGKKKGGPAKKRVKKESNKSGKNKSRRTLLARRPKSKNGLDTDGYALYEGKRSLLSWMIDMGIVPLSGKVKYKRGRKQKVLLEGKILKEGIYCECCNITYSVRDFESHAGSTPGKSYECIYLESGKSLFQCLVDSWRKHVETNKIEFVCVDVEGDDPNDDTCNVCGDGGDLICCDSCPSTFHNGCLRIKVPSGDWHCVYCSCKFCGMSCENTPTIDDDDDGDDHDLSSELLTCRLCEEKFHLHCVDDKIAEDFQDEGRSFCGKDCLKIREQLQDLLGVRHELGEEFSYTVLHHQVDSGDASLIDNYTKVECNSKVAVAFSVMNECFEPIIDERSGTNMIHNVVYNCGSNIRRLNYDGFYTIILEKGDNLVSAASIRIHGRQVAEMPFIGTRYMYRRQGMCSRLLTAIETVLSSLGVEKLVIPAISELNKTWTTVFGFLPLEDSKRHEMRYMSVIAFPGLKMLQKPVTVKEQKDSAASQCTEVGPQHSYIQESHGSDSSTSSDPNTIQPNNQDILKEQNKDTEAVSKHDISPEVAGVFKNNKYANVNSGMANEIDINIEAVDVEQSLDNGNCLDHVSSKKQM
ncbi:hypothetical protein ACS0TY_028345 [Phlomoides rotata]